MPKDVYNSHYEKLPNGEVRCIDDEIPFEIPESWCWVRMQDVLVFINGRAYKKEELLQRGKYKVLRVGNFFTNQSWYYSNLELPNEKYCYKGDLLYAWSASFGPRIWEGEKTIFHYHIWNVKYDSKLLLKKYLYYFLEYDKCHVKESTTGSTMIHVSMENMNPRLLPIPPLAEQQKIVERIEALFPIIEKYDKAQAELDLLNTDIYSLLKKSILQEAIQGRLVEQCEADEPATELLKRIQQEKQKLVKEGKLKAKDITDSIIYKGDDNKYYEKCGNAVACIDDEIPFEVPNTWSWCRLGDLISTKTGLAYSKPNLEIKSNNMVRVLRGGNISNGSWCMKSDDVMISSEFVKQDLYLRKGYFITPAVTSWENMGKTALVRENYDNVVVGGFVLMMCPFYTDGIVEEYLNYFFQSTMFQQYCQSITNKSGQAFYNLSRNKLLQLLIPIPPTEEQKRIYHRLNDALASIMSR